MIMGHLLQNPMQTFSQLAPSLGQSPQTTNAFQQMPTPTAMPTPDPYGAAVKTAEQQYPWLNKMGVPIRLTTGQGPFMSESYDPKAEDNPYPGNFTVQLRNPKLVNDPSQWPSSLGREGMDYMARHDPMFQSTAQQFRKLMTPDQLAISQHRYEREKAQHGESRSFEDFMKGAELQEFIGGYVFDMPGWKDVNYTPEQQQLLGKLKNYMWQGRKPTPLNFQ